MPYFSRLVVLQSRKNTGIYHFNVVVGCVKHFYNLQKGKPLSLGA